MHRPPVTAGLCEDEYRYLTDDRDARNRNELSILPGGNGDWYVGVMPEGSGGLGQFVRLSTSGGAQYACPGLTLAIAEAWRAMERAANGEPGPEPVGDFHKLLVSEDCYAGILGNEDRAAAAAAKAEIERLCAAIKSHHAARGHDRCWENDAALYHAAGLEPGDQQLPPRDEFRRRCQEYEARQYGEAEDAAEQTGDAAPWHEMLAQTETVFRNVLETSPVIAELRSKLNELQNATARAIAAERAQTTGDT